MDAKIPYLDISCTWVAALVRCMRSAIVAGRSVVLLVYEYRLYSFRSIDFGKVYMYLTSGSWMITSFCDVECCVVVVEPEEVVSRSGFIGVGVRVIYRGFQSVVSFGLVGGRILRRCLVGRFLV